MRSAIKIAVVVAVAGVIVFLALHFSGPKPAPTDGAGPTSTETTPVQTVTSQPNVGVKPTATISSSPQHETTATPGTTPTTAVPATGTGIITDWEQKIDEALASAKTETETGKELLALLPRMPEEGKVAAAQHIANLLANEDYPGFASYLTNSGTSQELRDVIFADLLNRPNSIKLPMLLEIARTDKTDQGTEAKNFLEVFIGEDFGQDWHTWDIKMKEWLKQNPDEPAPDSNGTASQ